METFVDCPVCTIRHKIDTKKTEDLKCPRCKIMESKDVGAILKELRKYVVPGQKPILDCLEILNEKIKFLEDMNIVSELRNLRSLIDHGRLGEAMQTMDQLEADRGV